MGVLLCVAAGLHAQYTIEGTVTDSLTREPLPYTSVYLKGTSEGGMTDEQGRFSFTTYRQEGRLVVSAVGYREYSKWIHPARGIRFKVVLAPATYNLTEVVVKPKREHYRKKNNPAVEFVRRMIEHRDDYSPDERDYWQRRRYEKTTFSINNFDSTKQQKRLYRKFRFLSEYADTSVVTGKPVLAVSNRELVATDYYRRSPRAEKQQVHARRAAGIDEMLSRQGMEQAISVTMTDVDIFQNNISLFTNKFVSPLSKMGPSFYKYYLMDTLCVAGRPCVDLAFVPFNSESFGFTGHLYVMMDSTYFVSRVVMNFPKKINLNFVDYMKLEQRFVQAPDGTRQLVSEAITTEFKLTGGDDGIHARREVFYSDYLYEPSAEAELVLRKPERVIESREAMYRSAAWWEEQRPSTINKKETQVDDMMARLRQVPVFYWTEKILKIAFTGYVGIPNDKSPRFYYGPVNTTFNGNALEGFRVRTGGMTTAWLHPRLFAKGYAAYGFKDHRVKGLAELEYSFHKKKEYANEFPIHSLKLSYLNDANQYGQNYLYTSKDNMFLALKRQKDDRIGYEQKAELTYTREFHSGFSVKAIGRWRRDESTYLVPFVRNDASSSPALSAFEALQSGATPVKNLQTSEVELRLRYAPNEKFFQTQWNRFPVSLDAPVFTLSHTMSAKDVLGSDYTYHFTEAGFQKRFWFSAFGYTDVILKAGKVWNKVPFPLLIMPNANLSYTIQPESYSLMGAMEFLNDAYASWDVSYYLNGWILNRIPLLKKLQWREVLSCRGLYGSLSDKNNPAVSDGLFAFPAGSSVMSHTPYIEVGVGVENIFKILRLDYVWRLTYRDRPDVDKSGMRLSVHMTF